VFWLGASLVLPWSFIDDTCFILLSQRKKKKILLLCSPFQRSSSTSEYHLPSNPAAFVARLQHAQPAYLLIHSKRSQFLSFCIFFSFRKRLMIFRCACTSYHFPYLVQQTLHLMNCRLIVSDNNQWTKIYTHSSQLWKHLLFMIFCCMPCHHHSVLPQSLSPSDA